MKRVASGALAVSSGLCGAAKLVLRAPVRLCQVIPDAHWIAEHATATREETFTAHLVGRMVLTWRDVQTR